MPTVIEVKNLKKNYGELAAVNGISFSVEKGEVFGLLCENGAGKTTTLEIIEGLRKATAGEISVLGFDVKNNINEIKERIGVQLQSSAYYKFLKLYEILELFGNFYHKNVNADKLFALFGLSSKAGQYIDSLSGGQKQRFSIVVQYLPLAPLLRIIRQIGLEQVSP